MNKVDYRKRVFEIINSNDFFAKKKFSQNFLLDDNIINNIIKAADIDDKTCVIEVGPGLGALTSVILSVAKQSLIYEVDTDLIPILNDFFANYKNYRIINKDFLKVNIDKDIEKYFKERNKIVLVSNLPYHITTPIIMKILEESNEVDSLILMMQYEVARRITSKPNTKDYNALSIIIQHQAKTAFLFKVPKTVFNPTPKVDSAVIRLDINKEIKNFDKDYRNFYKFVHNAFSQRRKTFVNNIANAYKSVDKNRLLDLLKNHHLDEKIRSEALKLEDFISLYDELKIYIN